MCSRENLGKSKMNTKGYPPMAPFRSRAVSGSQPGSISTERYRVSLGDSRDVFRSRISDV
jgi:hypothetical protein